MRNLDQLFNTVIGLEHLLASASQTKSTFPPYNTTKEGDVYTITMALAGYTKEELKITFEPGELKILGEPYNAEPEGVVYMHKGIAKRKFIQTFTIDRSILVDGIDLKDGLLTITLSRPAEQQTGPTVLAIK